MHLKDYYSILDLKPSATLADVKTAYRKLAQQYHPDKTANDAYATLQFAEIKEAYEILSNPGKKEHYLQQRWYDQGIGKKTKQVMHTPENILKQTMELDRYVARLDVYRMNKEGLYCYIKEIIAPDIISILNTFNDITINREIIGRMLHCAKNLLPNQANEIYEQLKKINADDLTADTIAFYIKQSRQTDMIERYRVWIIALLSIAITLLIFLIGK